MLLTNYVNDIGSLVFIDCKNNNVLEKILLMKKLKELLNMLNEIL